MQLNFHLIHLLILNKKDYIMKKITCETLTCDFFPTYLHMTEISHFKKPGVILKFSCY